MITPIVMIADTHVPRRAKALPRAVWQAIDDADLMPHAGDWVDEATLDDVVAPHCTYLTAVTDSGELRDVELHIVGRDMS
ncbi:metallophosphatase family protein [Agreia bicolorata]|uniref:Uncharacterized protein n=1 Tax=Agreia bicolorata TaxID=110935 RepID=A0ABR5CIX9_9MICO|nr:hypothetical protein TZ00_01900 [Agreia bicolorata]